MWGKCCCSLAVSLLLVAACTAFPDHDHTLESHNHPHHDKGEPHASHDHDHEKCHVLAPHNADFAFSLYKKLSALPDSKGKNVFFSPLGLTMALSLLALGAKGETHTELFKTLGYSDLSPAQVNEAYEHLLQMLDQSHDAGLQLESGSAVAIREGFKVLDKFLQDAQHFYKSEAFTVDFAKPETAAQEINKYIAKKTHDKITDMVKGLDPDNIMMLINYIFFRGKWEKPFELKHTHKADFHVDENTKVQVDMMKRTGRYDFYYDQGNHSSVLMLPYKGNASMMIILPDKDKMAEVEQLLSKEQIKHWHSSVFRSSVDICLPKFSISATYSLGDPLKEMGVVSAFSDTADFAGMSEETKLKVSKISQKAVLSVDEKGTEAAAATTIEIMPMSLPDSMELNRPFLLLIVDDSTKSILFMGKITDPTAE
ncbi:alpha-1-antitrypsin homolog [Chanos chanos]|uniref:Alpha-1-antitrypsin homolog n=1 Tax=Chanos chanos TaxID=29144 RepID=A0A6J2V5P4_CHACN|nr:alpha-1-antitrypsin homolog [Chanos chanos]